MGGVALLNYSQETGQTKGNKPGPCTTAHKLCADPVWAVGVVGVSSHEEDHKGTEVIKHGILLCGI